MLDFAFLGKLWGRFVEFLCLASLWFVFPAWEASVIVFWPSVDFRGLLFVFFFILDAWVIDFI